MNNFIPSILHKSKKTKITLSLLCSVFVTCSLQAFTVKEGIEYTPVTQIRIKGQEHLSLAQKKLKDEEHLAAVQRKLKNKKPAPLSQRRAQLGHQATRLRKVPLSQWLLEN